MHVQNKRRLEEEQGAGSGADAAVMEADEESRFTAREQIQSLQALSVSPACQSPARKVLQL